MISLSGHIKKQLTIEPSFMFKIQGKFKDDNISADTVF